MTGDINPLRGCQRVKSGSHKCEGGSDGGRNESKEAPVILKWGEGGNEFGIGTVAMERKRRAEKSFWWWDLTV